MATAASDTCETEQPLDDLLEAVAAGDRAAFRRLYDTSVPVLYAICMRLMRNQDLAHDTVQEALTKIWLKAHLFDRSKGKAIAWMAIVTRNCALSRLAAHAPPMLPLDEESALAAIDPRSHHDAASTIDVRQCLEQLDERYKKAVILIYFHGLTYDELAACMKAPVGTVKTWVHRAVRDLAVCMDQS